MNQRLRVTFFSVLITTLVSLGIGGFALQDSHNVAIRQVDSRLNFVIQTALQNQSDLLNAALFALDAGRIDASILLVTLSQPWYLLESVDLLYKILTTLQFAKLIHG